MIHAAADPLPALRDGQGSIGLFMLPKRASERHKAVAQKPAAQVPGIASYGCCNRKALNTVRKRDGLPWIAPMLETVPILPIAVEQSAITKIGDARAANPAGMRKSRRVPALAECKMQPLAAALHRSAVVRRAKENELAQTPRPIVSRLSAVMARASRHQASHAAPEDNQLLQRDGPFGGKSLQQTGKRAPVDGNMQAGVVVQIYRGVPQIAGERCAVIMAVPMPIAVVQTQAMHQHSQPAAERGESRRQALLVELQLAGRRGACS